MATIDPSIQKILNSLPQMPPLLQALLAQFAGSINVTTPPDKGTFARGGNLYFDPALLSAGGLTPAQLADTIAHEVAHAVLLYGSGNYVTGPNTPDAARQIGERSESEAYAGQYIVALQPMSPTRTLQSGGLGPSVPDAAPQQAASAEGCVRPVLSPRHSSVRRGRFPAAAIMAIVASCDSHPRDPQLEWGWVTNCTGPAFTRSDGSTPGPNRPVFRVTEQLVVAVPKEYRPLANSIDRAPRECTRVTDLPQVKYLQFVIQGNWSAGYNPADIPTLPGGEKQFRPDHVSVHIESEAPPAHVSPAELREMERLTTEALHKDSIGTLEAGGLTCLIDKSPGYEFCSGSRAPGDGDVTRLIRRSFGGTSFVLLQADYISTKYGRIHVYWQAWTSDVAHGLDIDRAVWNSLARWNLSHQP